MNMPGFTAEASIASRSYVSSLVCDTPGHSTESNLVEPAGCIVYDWVDFWLETGYVTDDGGMICTRD